jgi:hypothetical protein
MKMGTILPDWRLMARADAVADMQAIEDERKGDARWLPACKRRVGGEVRWYTDERRYHTMRNGIARTFEVREDGDYAVNDRATAPAR